MKILESPIKLDDLRIMASNSFGGLLKAVVDLDREVIAVDAELHSDLEALLLESGSSQESLWGINLYPEIQGEDFLEFDSMINVRPSQGNKSRGVEDEETRRRIIAVVTKWIRS